MGHVMSMPNKLLLGINGLFHSEEHLVAAKVAKHQHTCKGESIQLRPIFFLGKKEEDA